MLGYGVRRALLEHVVRQRVLGLPGVSVVQGRVDGLIVGGSSGPVSGVHLAASGAGRTRIGADLVVDAGGRASAAPAWLERAGRRPPDETLVNGFVGYASRWVRVPDDAWPGDMGFIAQLPMPGHTKGGILYPQDNGLHVMSLFGQARDYPPGDETAFMGFLEQCATPLLHQVMVRSEPVVESRPRGRPPTAGATTSGRPHLPVGSSRWATRLAPSIRSSARGSPVRRWVR